MRGAGRSGRSKRLSQVGPASAAAIMQRRCTMRCKRDSAVESVRGAAEAPKRQDVGTGAAEGAAGGGVKSFRSCTAAAPSAVLPRLAHCHPAWPASWAPPSCAALLTALVSQAAAR
jgi:hypothetical protein